MIIVNDKTKCNHCNMTINKDDKIIILPPIIENKKDKVYFDEMVLHYNCFIRLKNHNEILDLINRYKISFNKKCSICGKSIIHFDDYYNHNVLSSDKDNLLFNYNFKEYHKDCYFNSELRAKIRKKIDEMIVSGLWVSFSSLKKY